VTTLFGEIRVKRVSWGGVERAYPEFEDLKAAALRTGETLETIRAAVSAALSASVSKPQ